jgi:hypothetical protein
MGLAMPAAICTAYRRLIRSPIRSERCAAKGGLMRFWTARLPEQLALILDSSHNNLNSSISFRQVQAELGLGSRSTHRSSMHRPDG